MTEPEDPVQLVETVRENKMGFTDRQLKLAKVVRNMVHSVGFPTYEDLKKIVRLNTIQNCPVTAEHVAVAEKVYGKDIASVKGKATRRKPPTVTIDTVDIPPELKLNQQLVDLCIDAFFVNRITFLGSISKRLQYR